MTQDELKAVLDYDPVTGHFTWKVRAAPWIPIGSRAGSVAKNGYVTIRIRKVLYYAHRLAFLFMTGTMPEFVDHIDGLRGDNRWTNLREATHQDNTKNCAISKNNRSGAMGVHWDKRKGKWVARVMVDGRTKFLGHFDNVPDAAAARKAADAEFGFHPNHGRPITA